MVLTILIMSLDLVPLIIATIAPLFPFADLFVIIVYNSPLESDVSSILSLYPKFLLNNNQSAACSF